MSVEREELSSDVGCFLDVAFAGIEITNASRIARALLRGDSAALDLEGSGAFFLGFTGA